MSKSKKLFDDMTEAEVLEEIQKTIDSFPGLMDFVGADFAHDDCVDWGVKRLGLLIDEGHRTLVPGRRAKEREVLIAHFLPFIHRMVDEAEMAFRRELFTWEVKKARAVPLIEQSFAAVGIPVRLTCHKRIIRLDAKLSNQFRASMMLGYNMADKPEDIEALAVSVSALQNAALHIGHRLNITPLKSKF